MGFLQNALLLNPDKTEAIIFGTRQPLASIQMSAGVGVAGTVVRFAEAVKLLGVTLDPALTFNQHVTDVDRACTYHTCALHHIRPLLTVAAVKSIATSIIGARLDYCNSLLYGTSECNLDRLQRVQNQLVCVVLQAPWTASATDLCRQLHWLPIRQRIAFKLAAVAYKTRQPGIPEYLHCDIRDYQLCRTLLQQPSATTASTSRAFCVAAPTVWNSHDVHTHSADKFLTSENRLKTELFKSCYV